MTNIFLISKPKKLSWFYKLFKMQPFIVDTMFSNQINPVLPKGFTKYKLIGKKESIWKPISALKPNELVPVGFVRKNKKYQATFSFTHQTVEEWEGIIKEFCSLNYFLNDYEKLKERVKKLEEK